MPTNIKLNSTVNKLPNVHKITKHKSSELSVEHKLFFKNIIPESSAKYKYSKLSIDYKPSKDEEYMCLNQLEYFRQKLLKWKNDLLVESQETLTHLREENRNEADSNDRASSETERAIELRTRSRYRKLCEKIEEALLRIENKEYGYCEETGEPIGIRRLEARPIATLCIEAQERHENYEKNHLDEPDR